MRIIIFKSIALHLASLWNTGQRGTRKWPSYEVIRTTLSPASELSGGLWGWGGKKKESLQLRLWNLNSTSNSPVAPRRLSCQISTYQSKAKTSANVNKHWKTRTKGNDVITNITSANRHFASSFSMQIFKFQRRSCRFSFFSRPAAIAPPESLLAR